MSLQKVICIPEICSGSPTLEGTRLTCNNIIRLIASNHFGLDHVIDSYDVDKESIINAVQYCANLDCVNDPNLVNYCEGCTLDTRPIEDGENPLKGWILARAIMKNDLSSLSQDEWHSAE